eukprot:TRINITY_DN2469_c0_g1::TRINITY_DN2469_c0_g1_i1::g.8805::m.8805 TRINITY_DN2469_c0_g1::TRINITY_DN2469_c0_g1_i1::g.8805  ORF type:complete len:272 (+),score=14.81,sp/Q7M3S9/RNGB_DICDI/39.22/4e-07,zf-C3HC4_3/PF13920.1/5.7e-11,Prok-RING_4/PF14447.1/0.00055,IncA/PF04156.9/0.027,zf-C3HC4_2/PF13923.1/0.037,CALCOCO1/PF07888.6/0.059,bZIP_2/PF07716.10/1,Seryl_tRNA_N/PF02403.17/0.62 TRINITY_DN2469_c0_g1_i1:104-919(+)
MSSTWAFIATFGRRLLSTVKPSSAVCAVSAVDTRSLAIPNKVWAPAQAPSKSIASRFQFLWSSSLPAPAVPWSTLRFPKVSTTATGLALAVTLASASAEHERSYVNRFSGPRNAEPRGLSLALPPSDENGRGIWKRQARAADLVVQIDAYREKYENQRRMTREAVSQLSRELEESKAAARQREADLVHRIQQLEDMNRTLSGRLQQQDAQWQRKIDAVQDQLTCVICTDAARTQLFEPCHHAVACHDCTSHISACPICRADITTSTQMILS